ncbi:MAG: TolC family protein [Candidatus Hydrogenedentes bacterium]|nr:TolC family protein [Candidatus Hydrogenedentota bacterium]
MKICLFKKKLLFFRLIFKYGYSLLFLIFLLLTNCGTLNGNTKTLNSIDSVSKEIQTRGVSLEDGENTLSLDDCIRIALKNNVLIRTAEVEKKISKLDKNIAFSNFLPQIVAEYQLITYDRQPMVSLLGPFPVAMQDKTIRMADMSLQMPIFAPATWFIYDLRKKGVSISNILYEYTCQMIAFQTTVLYYQLLLLYNLEKTLEFQLKSVDELKSQIESFYEEGLITQSQLEKILLLKQLREHDLSVCRYEIQNAKGKLNSVMGIFPTEDISLKFQDPISLPEGDLEDWILECLENHPRLKIEEKKIEVASDQVKLAISQFLPVLGAFSQWQYTSNSFNFYSQSVMNGLFGMLTVFNGFRNIQEYKKARLTKEKTFIELENTVLSLIVGILSAKSNLDKAIEDIKLAEKALIYQKEYFREIQEKWNEGVVSEVDLVSAKAELDIAEINLMTAKIQEQIARALVWNSIGKTYKGNILTSVP